MQPLTDRRRIVRGSESTYYGIMAIDGLRTIAVVDIGSNSGRVLVLQRDEFGHLDVLQDEGAPLRLVEALDGEGRFSDQVIDRTVEVMRDFRAIATSAGAGQMLAVATAAVREAPNGTALVQRIREALCCEVEVISGKQEAAYAFTGALHGLPVDDGLLIDQGGGSMQFVRFRGRQAKQSWTFPLGALRLSGRFLRSDPPTIGERHALAGYVERELTDAKLPRLQRGGELVGTGGTIRTLAKIDRRTHKYPISRLHGYVLSRTGLDHVAARLGSAAQGERSQIPGLSADRLDSIAAGAFAIQRVMEIVGARRMLVSGQGLREGLALSSLGDGLHPAAEVRKGAIAELAARFTSWRPETAARRRALALVLLEGVDPQAPAGMRELLGHAATILDIGRSVDFYNRHEHTAAMLIATDLEGFTHPAVALLAAIIERSGGKKAVKAYRPLVTQEQEWTVVRYGAILRVADELERRHPPGAVVDFAWEQRGSRLEIRAPWLSPSRLATILDPHGAVFHDTVLLATD